jgi:dihydropyrimidinase
MRFDTTIINGTVVIPRRGPLQLTVAIKDGKVAALVDPGLTVEADEEIDARGLVILPGLIDPHMHIGFVGQPLTDVASETRSAAVGGVTSILNYVLKPAGYDEPVAEFIDHVERLAFVDMGIHLGIFSDTQIAEVPRYISEFGVSSFKFFMSYKGDEGAKRGVGDADDGLMWELMTTLAAHPGTVVNVHAENIEMVWRAEGKVRDLGSDGLAAHNASRPGVTEAVAMVTAAYLARAAGCPLYLVHMSSKEAVEEVGKLPRGTSPLYVETTPHYLSLTVGSDCDLLAKVNPPVRTFDDVEALWGGVKSGLIDTVGNDHSARFRSEKGGNVWSAGAAFPGVGTMLAILLTEGYHRRGISLQRIAEISSYNTARIFNLYPRKGTIEVGSDADLAIVDLDQEMVVSSEYLQSRADFSPWEGMSLRGWAVRTLVRGQTVMLDGEIVGHQGFGEYLRRPTTEADAAEYVGI